MTLPSSTLDRRTMLKSAAGLAAGLVGLDVAHAAEAADLFASKGGDFGFLAGHWKISHRRLKNSGSDDWDVFEGEATVWPASADWRASKSCASPRAISAGMGVRLFHVEKASVGRPLGQRPERRAQRPMMGSFETASAPSSPTTMDGDRPIKARGVWDRITPTSCRWHQATSSDGGKTWEGNWYMDWVRA